MLEHRPPRARDAAPALQLDPVDRVAREAATLGRPAALPHRGELERAFGESFAGLTVRTGAAAELRAIGADAATTGDAIVFATHAPPLETVAHELAHVIQNRRAAAAVPAGAGALDAPAEQEADAVAGAVVAGEPFVVAAPPAGEVQTNPLDWFRKKKTPQGPAPAKTYTDAQLAPNGIERGQGGTANRVDRVKYAEPIGTSGQQEGFFKPAGAYANPQDTFEERENTRHVRAVAASTLDKHLFGVLSDEQFAHHGTEKGAVSAKVAGTPVFEGKFTKDVGLVTDETNRMLLTDPMSASNYRAGKDGHVYRKEGNRYHAHDYKDPRVQRGLADLQLMDAITGEVDRHGGNIYIDDRSGKVTGIDNDANFDERDTTIQEFDKFTGMPMQVHEETAAKLLSMKAKDLPKILNRGRADDEKLSPEQIKVLQKRMRDTKKHVKQLKKDGKLVKAFDDRTYDEAMANRRETGTVKQTSYLQRSVDARTQPNEHDTVVPLPPPKSTKPQLKPRPNVQRPGTAAPKPLPPIPDRGLKPPLRPRRPVIA